MKRKQFIQSIGAAGAALFLPKTDVISGSNSEGGCALVPTETAGPFPLDLTENDFFFRQDIRENEPGVQVNLRMRIIGTTTCAPLPNLRVNIWHCDHLGVYSGYNTGSNPGNVEDTQLRGYQITDTNGEVTFTTVFPGWYPGRITHIHFQVHVSANYSAVSQFTFPLDIRDQIHGDNPLDYPEGLDPLSYNQDGAFVDGYELQLATLTAGKEGQYDSFIAVAIVDDEITRIGHIERSTAERLEVGQNYPNPFKNKTNIPLHIKQGGNVFLEVWSLQGSKIYEKNYGPFHAGSHELELDASALKLSKQNYVYQIVFEQDGRVFRVPKVLTVH